MKIRLVPPMLALALCMPAAFADDTARAKEEAALRAQIAHTDDEVQKLASQLHALERDHPSDTAQRSELQDRIRKLDYEEDKTMARLRTLMAQDPPDQRRSTPAIEEAKPAAVKPVASPEAAAPPAAAPASGSH